MKNLFEDISFYITYLLISTAHYTYSYPTRVASHYNIAVIMVINNKNSLGISQSYDPKPGKARAKATRQLTNIFTNTYIL